MLLAVIPDHHVEVLLTRPGAAYAYLQGEWPAPGWLARMMSASARRPAPRDWPVAPAAHVLVFDDHYPMLIHYLLTGGSDLGHGVADAVLGAYRGTLPGVRQLGPYHLHTFLHDKSQAAAFNAHLRGLSDSIVEARWLEDVAARGELADRRELADFQEQLGVLRDVYAQAAQQSCAVLFAPIH